MIRKQNSALVLVTGFAPTSHGCPLFLLLLLNLYQAGLEQPFSLLRIEGGARPKGTHILNQLKIKQIPHHTPQNLQCPFELSEIFE